MHTHTGFSNILLNRSSSVWQNDVLWRWLFGRLGHAIGTGRIAYWSKSLRRFELWRKNAFYWSLDWTHLFCLGYGSLNEMCKERRDKENVIEVERIYRHPRHVPRCMESRWKHLASTQCWNQRGKELLITLEWELYSKCLSRRLKTHRTTCSCDHPMLAPEGWRFSPW